jgi:hypothetical protein
MSKFVHLNNRKNLYIRIPFIQNKTVMCYKSLKKFSERLHRLGRRAGGGSRSPRPQVGASRKVFRNKAKRFRGRFGSRGCFVRRAAHIALFISHCVKNDKRIVVSLAREVPSDPRRQTSSISHCKNELVSESEIERINELHNGIKRAARKMLKDAIEIGVFFREKLRSYSALCGIYPGSCKAGCFLHQPH